jgi:spore coat polysaccharide biosynthesis protein SpsF (cytidylyltransferase family)
MSLLVIIQARLSSLRLPNKVNADIAVSRTRSGAGPREGRSE